jgi:hypothetical protein
MGSSVVLNSLLLPRKGFGRFNSVVRLPGVAWPWKKSPLPGLSLIAILVKE